MEWWFDQQLLSFSTVAYDILLASSRPSFFGRQGQVCGIASWSPQPNDKHLPRMFECGGLILSSFATLKLNVIKYDQPSTRFLCV